MGSLKAKVKLITYDSAKNESADEFESVMSLIASDPDTYEIISMDKTITPMGSFVCAVLYKEVHAGDDLSDEDTEIIADLDENDI